MPDRFPRFSLLFADPNSPVESGCSSAALEFIGPIRGEDPQILTKILSWKTSRKDQMFRKEILEDFLQNPALLTKVEGLLRRWEKLEEVAKRETLPPKDASWEEAFAAMQENARSLMEHLRFLRLSYEELAGQTPDSGGLFALTEYLRRHGSSPAVKALMEQVASYPLLRPEQAKSVLHLHLDRYGTCASADVTYLGPDDEKYLKKHTPKKEEISLTLPKEKAPELTALALGRLCEAFRRITAGIRLRFSPLQEGMVFYRYALSTVEWARSRGYAWRFATPTAERGPVGRGIRNLSELEDGAYRPPLTCTARSLEVYSGEWGSEMLKILARTQIFAAAGLPIVAEDLMFCPEERLLVYSSAGKTMEEEIAALADLHRETRRGDILLLDHPLITVGNTPAAEIVGNLLRAFHKKGAAVRLATDLLVR